MNLAPPEQDSEADPHGVVPDKARSARLRYPLEDSGFDEVPARYRRFYRRLEGPGDAPAKNEILCPVCHTVVRAHFELRAGDRLYCMPCLTRLELVETEGRLEALSVY